MSAKRAAPYGTWPSPWTAERISSAEVRASEVRLDGGDVYWLERRPAEGGRSVVVRRDGAGRAADAIPATANARNAVYEYGGGSYTVAGGDIFYTDFGDQRVWIAPARGGEPRPLTVAGPWRFADLTFDPARRRLYAIQEDRSTKPEPTHRVVAIDLDAPASGAQPEVLVEGDDFYASPAPSPDGSKLAWLSWRHPDMPWDRTELWVAEVHGDGTLGRRQRVAGGDRVESIREPRFSPAGALCFVSDRTGYWNLYRLEGRVTALTTLDAEVGGPQWVFGESYYAFAGDDDVLLSANHGGTWRLHRLRSGVLEDVTDRFTDVRYVRTDGERVVFAGASPVEPSAVVSIALRGGAGAPAGQVEILRRASDLAIDQGYLSPPRPIEVETTGGERAHGFFYAPAHAELEGPAGEQPPLAGALSRRADFGGVVRARARHPVLDQPRLRGDRPRLPRLDRVRSRLPREALRPVGRRRGRRLRCRGAASGRRRRDRSARARSFAAPAPAATPRSPRSRSATRSGRERATSASAISKRWLATPTSSNRAISIVWSDPTRRGATSTSSARRCTPPIGCRAR